MFAQNYKLFAKNQTTFQDIFFPWNMVLNRYDTTVSFKHTFCVFLTTYNTFSNSQGIVPQNKRKLQSSWILQIRIYLKVIQWSIDYGHHKDLRDGTSPLPNLSLKFFKFSFNKT